MELIFASHNEHKALEIEKILNEKIKIKSLTEIGWKEEIEETGSTIEANAILKAKAIYDSLLQDCFAEDTGLEVEALNNAPGVHTARYAGEQKNTEDNINLLLKNLTDSENRNVQFRTVICLILEGQQYLFEGKLIGKIATTKKGEHGFGYDPIFIPNEYSSSLAELGEEIKNKISHRKKAISKMVDFLEQRKFNK